VYQNLKQSKVHHHIPRKHTFKPQDQPLKMSAQGPIEAVDDAEGFEEVDDEFANSNQQPGTYSFRRLRN
jgi:hypothetical protein